MNNNTISENSTPPSGFTDELELLGPNWPDISTEEKSQDINSNKENCNSKIITQNNSSKDNENDINQNNNNDENDPSYDPRQNTDSATSKMSSVFEKSPIKEKSSSFDNGCPLDIRKLIVPVTTSEKRKTKKHFCPFCKILQTKFARHLQLKHKNEEEVKKFIYLPKKIKNELKLSTPYVKEETFFITQNLNSILVF